MTQLNVTEAQGLIGKTVSVPFGDVRFDCRILNVKQSYGIIRYEIEPVSGSGKQWINADKARFTN